MPSPNRYDAPGPLEPAPSMGNGPAPPRNASSSNYNQHHHLPPPAPTSTLLSTASFVAQIAFFIISIVVFSLGISGLSSKITDAPGYDEIFTVIGSLFIVPFVVIVLRFVTPYLPKPNPNVERLLWYYTLRAVLLFSYVAQAVILIVYMATYMTDVPNRLFLLFLIPDSIVFILMLLPSRFTTVWSHLYVMVLAVKLGLLWSYLDNEGVQSGGGILDGIGGLGRGFNTASSTSKSTSSSDGDSGFAISGLKKVSEVVVALWNGDAIPYSRTASLSDVLDYSSRTFSTADSISNKNSELGVNGLLSTLMLSIPMVNYPAVLSKLQSGMSIFDSYAHNMAAVFAHTIHIMDVLEMYMLGVQRQQFAATVQYMILIFSLMGFVSCNIYYTSLFFSDAAVDRMIRRFQPTAMDSLETASLDQTLLHYFMWVVFFVDLPYAAMRWVAFCVHGTQLSTFFAKNVVMLVSVAMLMMYHAKGTTRRK